MMGNNAAKILHVREIEHLAMCGSQVEDGNDDDDD